MDSLVGAFDMFGMAYCFLYFVFYSMRCAHNGNFGIEYQDDLLDLLKRAVHNSMLTTEFTLK